MPQGSPQPDVLNLDAVGAGVLPSQLDRSRVVRIRKLKVFAL